MSTTPDVEPTETFSPSDVPARRSLKLSDVDFGAISRHPLALPTLLALVGLVLAFWPMIRALPARWNEDEYYSHGWLVPALSVFIVIRRWPKIRDTKLSSGWWAILLMIPLLPIVYAAYVGNILAISSVLFVMLAILAVTVVAGWRWGLALAPAIGFLLFGFPVWNSFIDGYTNPLQLASTQVAFQLLQVFGFKPFQPDATTIYLNAFTLDVGVPCSGMKLVLAVSAFTTLFVLIANLKTWANLLMVAFIIPLCLFVNGLRIALIGVVGDQFGNDAGHQFHDYSGYITLVVCFFLLFKFARLLGWKD